MKEKKEKEEHQYKRTYRNYSKDDNWGVAIYYWRDDDDTVESIETTYRGDRDGTPYWDVVRRNVTADEPIEVLGELLDYEDEQNSDGEGTITLAWTVDGREYMLQHAQHDDNITIEEL